jgi:hypothetical protein
VGGEWGCGGVCWGYFCGEFWGVLFCFWIWGLDVMVGRVVGGLWRPAWLTSLIRTRSSSYSQAPRSSTRLR